MDRIISGVVGGLISIAVTAWVIKRSEQAPATGRLQHGPFMWIVGLAALLIAITPVVATLYFGDHDELVAKAAITIFMGLGAGFCLAEAALVNGNYDSEGIEFKTPWARRKLERWQDLQSVELNKRCAWYTFTFKSGTKIRLSRYLNGHLAVLEAAGQSGIRAQ